jgi:Arc/MetJ-type ribon-helix-helix transcriptional regulator
MDFRGLCCFCLVESCGGAWVKLITLYLPEPYLKALQDLVDDRYYPNRAEAIRVAVRDLLNAEAWRKNASG